MPLIFYVLPFYATCQSENSCANVGLGPVPPRFHHIAKPGEWKLVPPLHKEIRRTCIVSPHRYCHSTMSCFEALAHAFAILYRCSRQTSGQESQEQRAKPSLSSLTKAQIIISIVILILAIVALGAASQLNYLDIHWIFWAGYMAAPIFGILAGVLLYENNERSRRGRLLLHPALCILSVLACGLAVAIGWICAEKSLDNLPDAKSTLSSPCHGGKNSGG